LLKGEAAEIIDYVTSRIDKLNVVNKIVKNKGLQDEMLEGKIFELEDLREWITENYFS
jgi:hypothetical protein